MTDLAKNKALEILQDQNANAVSNKDDVKDKAQRHYDAYFEGRHDEHDEEFREEILGYMRLFLFVASRELESNKESDASAAAPE